MWESNPSSSIYLRNSSLSEFGWRQSSSPLEMEKTNAHCHGCQPYQWSNNEALDLNSKGGAKMTGNRDFFFFNFNFIECRKKNYSGSISSSSISLQEQQRQKHRSCILALGPAVQVFQAVDPTFQDGSTFLFVLCHDLGCGASCPGSLWPWLSSASLNYPGSG